MANPLSLEQLAGNLMSVRMSDGSLLTAVPNGFGFWTVSGGGGGTGPGPGNGQFSLPFSFNTVTSEFGPRDGPSGSFHEGIDMGNPPATAGANVLVSNDGTVSFAGYNGAFGNQVRVFHGTFGEYDIYTTYNHMQDGSISVSAGQQINKATKVGNVGNTGVGFGAHLHWETHLCAVGSGIVWNTSNNGGYRTAVNPRDFIVTYGDGNVLVT